MTLRAAVEAMLAAQSEMGITATAATKDPSQRYLLVSQRRDFATHITSVIAEADLDPRLAANPVLLEEFRVRFSRMRHKIALHQGKWPAVLLDNAEETYQISVNDLIEENGRFTDWVAATLR